MRIFEGFSGAPHVARGRAAHHRARLGSILAYGGYGDPMPNYRGFQVSSGAIEALRRTLSRELGPKGARVLTLQTRGITEDIPDRKTREAIEESIAKPTMPWRAARVEARVERAEAKVGGGEDTTPIALRVTLILRPEEGEWKIVHRHADPTATARPAESVIQE